MWATDENEGVGQLDMSRWPEFDLGLRCGIHTEGRDEKRVIHGRDGYLEGHHKDPNANEPAVSGERGRRRRHYCSYNESRRQVAGFRSSMVRIRHRSCDLTCLNLGPLISQPATAVASSGIRDDNRSSPHSGLGIPPRTHDHRKPAKGNNIPMLMCSYASTGPALTYF